MFFGMLFCMSLGFAQQQTDSTTVQHLDEVVVTNSKFNLKRSNSGKVITKISQKDLQHMQGQTVAQIINTTAGIEINGTKGNAGQNQNYYIRGGRNRQVLVLIDGVPVADASQIANDYDLRLLNTDMIESIEILKGASSVLYGSGAATAVINIKLKKATKNAISGNFKSTFGTNQNQNDNDYSVERFVNNVSVNGTLNKFDYLIGFGNQYESGLSAMKAGTKKDVYNAINGNAKIGYRFSDVYKITAYVNFDKFKADFDDASTFMDANNRSVSEQYRLGLSQRFNYKNGSITANTAYNTIERNIQSNYPAKYNSKSFVADVYNRYTFNSKIYSILGVNLQDSNMESFVIPFGGTDLEQSINPDIASFTIVDPYINAVYESGFGLNINAGLRLNNHSEYGSHLVYSLNPSFKFDTNFGYAKILSSYSTAYITPSLYQLFEPTYGNADLKPEDNTTFEIGAEIDFNGTANISLVYFSRKETNFIDFVDLGNWVYQYSNVEQDFTASGLEFVGTLKFLKSLKLNANATYTKVEDNLNLRIPKFKANARVDYQMDAKTMLSVSYQFNDYRNDAYFDTNTFMTQDVVLKSYSLLDLYLSRNILKNKMMVFANITNLLNEDYTELYGYTTKGRNINLGFSLSL